MILASNNSVQHIQRGVLDTPLQSYKSMLFEEMWHHAQVVTVTTTGLERSCEVALTVIDKIQAVKLKPAAQQAGLTTVSPRKKPGRNTS